jgi:hypothetical protein
MMNRSAISALIYSVLFLPTLACGSGSGSSERSSAPVVDSSTAGQGEPSNMDPPDAGQSWERLVEGSWSLAPASEDTRWCQKIVLSEDIYVSAMRPVHPPGTHHTTLALIPDDGKPTCSGGMFGAGLIYAAGAGTGELHMPKGVAMKLPAGKAIILGLHVYNTSEEPLSGVSAIEIVRAKPEEVQTEADMLIAGPTNFALPPGETTTVTGNCRMSVDQTAFTLFPHMHQLGVHIKTTAMLDGQPLVLHDGDYQFQEQYQLPIGPIAFHAGDSVATECTYQNSRSSTVKFGESSDTEMCFSILFRYPSGGAAFCNTPGASQGM